MFLNLAFGQVGEKKIRQRLVVHCILIDWFYLCFWPTKLEGEQQGITLVSNDKCCQLYKVSPYFHLVLCKISKVFYKWHLDSVSFFLLHVYGYSQTCLMWPPRKQRNMVT